jgi:hypothetical protein
VQKRSVCLVEHRSNLPFAKQALTAWLVMFQRAFFIPLSRKSSVEIFPKFTQHFSSRGACRSAAPAAVRRPLCHHPPRRPLLHTPGRVQRGNRHRQPPEGVHDRGCRARQSAPPRPTARQAPRRFGHGQMPRQLRRGQAGIICAPLGLYTFNGAAAKRSRNRFLLSAEVFALPGLAEPSMSPQQRNPPRQGTPPWNPPWYPQRQRTPPERMDL